MSKVDFAEWFKREYPLYERDGASRDTSLKAALRIAWETAESQSLSQEAVRDEALEEAARACYPIIRREQGWKEDNHVALLVEAQNAIRALKREPNAAVGPTCPSFVCLTPKGCAIYGCKLQPPGASDD